MPMESANRLQQTRQTSMSYETFLLLRLYLRLELEGGRY